jgi:hypothetical protein
MIEQQTGKCKPAQVLKGGSSSAAGAGRHAISRGDHAARQG